MARIYLARTTGPGGFKKHLALKLIHAHLSTDPLFVEMFLNEAALAARLNHPNIVQLFDLGTLDNVYFMVMEFLNGESLFALQKKLCRGDDPKPMDPMLAVHVVTEACEGLHYAHTLVDENDEPLDIIHRDVSPHNIFVTYFGEVKVMDFGIARAACVSSTTRTGVLKGKVAYMSPEQVLGRKLDCRSDVFALGTVLWELVTGRRLFKSSSEFETIKRITDADPEPLSAYREGIPNELEAVVQKSLAKDRDERFASAREFHDALRQAALAMGTPVSARDLSESMANWFGREMQRKKQVLQGQFPRGAPAASGPFPVAAPLSRSLALPPPSGGNEITSSGATVADLSKTPGEAPNMASTGNSPAVPGGLAAQLLADSAVTEVPVTAPQSGQGPPAAASVPQTPPRRGSVRAGLGVALVIAAVLGGVALTRGGGSPQAQTPATTEPGVSANASAEGPAAAAVPPASPGETPPRPSDPGRPAADNMVTLQLEGVPEGGTVTIGNRVYSRPDAMAVPRSDEQVRVEIAAPGYQGRGFYWTPNQNARRFVQLTAAKNTGRVRPAPTPQPQTGSSAAPVPAVDQGTPVDGTADQRNDTPLVSNPYGR
jgi:serine/threonine-protein kinase